MTPFAIAASLLAARAGSFRHALEVCTGCPILGNRGPRQAQLAGAGIKGGISKQKHLENIDQGLMQPVWCFKKIAFSSLRHFGVFRLEKSGLRQGLTSVGPQTLQWLASHPCLRKDGTPSGNHHGRLQRISPGTRNL